MSALERSAHADHRAAVLAAGVDPVGGGLAVLGLAPIVALAVCTIPAWTFCAADRAGVLAGASRGRVAANLRKRLRDLGVGRARRAGLCVIWANRWL